MINNAGETLSSPSANTVLAPKYHFHTDVNHYHQEVRDKDGTSPTPIVFNPYCPLGSSEPLLRVPYTCPLFEPSQDTKAIIALVFWEKRGQSY